MPTFIKSGFWIKSKKQLEGYLNLDKLIASISPSGRAKEFIVRFGSTQENENNIPFTQILTNDFEIGDIEINRQESSFSIISNNSSFVIGKTIIEIDDDFTTRPFIIFKTNMEELSESYCSVRGYDITTFSSMDPTTQFDQLIIKIKVYN